MSVRVSVCVCVLFSSFNKYILYVFIQKKCAGFCVSTGETVVSRIEILPFMLQLFLLSSLWPTQISKSTYRLKSLNNKLSLKNATLPTLFSF